MKDDRNTAFGWILFSGVIALGAMSVSSMIFHADDSELPEGAKPGFFIEGEEAGGAEASGPPLANLLASGSASAGEAIFAKADGIATRSAGTASSARRQVSLEDIRWADLILVMEEKHAARLKADFRQDIRFKRLHVLDIPDDYKFMDTDLVALIRTAAEPLIFGNS